MQRLIFDNLCDLGRIFVRIDLREARVFKSAESRMTPSKSNMICSIGETARAEDYDWVILGASHAMTLDFADFNAVMESDTGLRILNLAGPGTGPLYNEFVLAHFFRELRMRNVLYVLDSFAFYDRTRNEERFSDTKLLSRTPFDLALAQDFVRSTLVDGVEPQQDAPGKPACECLSRTRCRGTSSVSGPPSVPRSPAAETRGCGSQE